MQSPYDNTNTNRQTGRSVCRYVGRQTDRQVGWYVDRFAASEY